MWGKIMPTPRCAKCLTEIKGKVVRDIEGKCFCSEFCRSEWWAEERKRNEGLYNWWIGG